MLRQTGKLFAVGVVAFGMSVAAASADSCSGHSHTTGTVLGAVGGGVIGGAVTHGNIAGVAGGAVLGGLTGNAIARNADCSHRHHYHRYWSARYRRYYWRREG
jgi:uncharacterized protein YcfJ